MADANNPWNQQPGEGPGAYNAFKMYLALGPGRTVVDAYFRRPGATPVNRGGNRVASGTWKNWSRKWKWLERARAYDEVYNPTPTITLPPPRLPIDDKPAPEPIRRMSEASEAAGEAVPVSRKFVLEDEAQERDWGKERTRIRNHELHLADRLITKAYEMLSVALINKKVVPADPARGVAETHIYMPAKWSFKTVAEIVEVATRLRRMAAEMPINVQIEEGATAAEQDAMFAHTMGQLEEALPTGIVPAMPADPTERPQLTVTRDVDSDDLRVPEPRRPD